MAEHTEEHYIWLNGLSSELAAACRLLRRLLGKALQGLFLPAFGAKLGLRRNFGVASWADFEQDRLMESCAAEIAVIRVRCYL